MPNTFTTFRTESLEAWIIIHVTSMYVHTVHISCIQGCVCILFWVFFIIVWPLAVFYMPQCLMWFSLFWTHIVLWHVPWLQFLTDPMPAISVLSCPFGSRAGSWSMSHVNFRDLSRVYAVQVRDFPDDTNHGWCMRNKLVDQFQSRGDVATYSGSSTQCLKTTCSTRLSALCGWQNPRGDTQNFWQQGKTADCRLCGKCWRKKPAVPRTYLAFQLFLYVLLSSHSLSSCLACCSSWTVLGQLCMTEQPFCFEMSRRAVSCWQR